MQSPFSCVDIDWFYTLRVIEREKELADLTASIRREYTKGFKWYCTEQLIVLNLEGKQSTGKLTKKQLETPQLYYWLDYE